MASSARAGLVIFGVVCAAGLSAPAMAQDRGFYLGAALGQSDADIDCTGTTSCDNKDNSWKILGGYQFNRNFALEFGYADLGAPSASTPPFFFPGLGTVPAGNLKIETTVFELVAVGTLPLTNQFSIYGKLGLYRADTETSASFANGVSASESDSNNDLTFGVGARFDFTRNLGIRLEWQQYGGVTEPLTGEEFDIDVISAGVIFRF
jgi:OmpA-OmpF porin, OOP family